MDFIYDIRVIMYAKAALWQLVAVGIVAGVAFSARSRLVFLLGSVGVLLGFFVPQPLVRADYSTAEAAFLGAIDFFVDHTVYWSYIGAGGGTLAGLAITWFRRSSHSTTAQPEHGRSAESPST